MASRRCILATLLVTLVLGISGTYRILQVAVQTNDYYSLLPSQVLVALANLNDELPSSTSTKTVAAGSNGPRPLVREFDELFAVPEISRRDLIRAVVAQEQAGLGVSQKAKKTLTQNSKIRSWGCKPLSDAPFIFVHIGKAGTSTRWAWFDRC